MIYYGLSNRPFPMTLSDLQGRLPTGWAKKVDHYIWRLTSSVYILKMPERIYMIFGTLQHRFILNTSIDSVFLKFVIQGGTTWEINKQSSALANATGSSACLAELVWTNCWTKSTAAMYWKTGRWRPSMICLNNSKHCTCWQFDLQTAPKKFRSGRKSREREDEASANGDVISWMHFASKQRTYQRDLVMLFVKSIIITSGLN